MLSKKILIPAIVLSIASTGAALWSTGLVKAQGVNNRQGIVEDLAQKLNLDQSKVSTAFDEIKSERETERKAQMEKKLDQAVSDNLITADQKQKILDKCTDMEQKRETERKEMQAWAETNGIDMNKLRNYGIGFGGGNGFRSHGGPKM